MQLVADLPVADQVAVDPERPALIFSRWLMQRRKVDFPEPEGPSRHEDLARLDLHRDPLQHLEAPKGLVDVPPP